MTVPAAYDVLARNIDPAAANPIHDDDVAQQHGFTGALVPGVELFAYCTAPFVAAWGEAWLGGGALAVRFRRPVHDGEQVTVDVQAAGSGFDVVLRGPDGGPRTTGVAAPPADQPPPDLARCPEAPLPDALQDEPRLGPFGTVSATAERAACERYLDDIAEVLPLYRERGLVHPGLVLRLVNSALMANVVLGPWIHTASDCRLLSAVRVGQHVEVRSAVTDVFVRNGHSYVRYDALVLADGRPAAQVDHEAIWRLRT
jgi:acyl dehydratase